MNSSSEGNMLYRPEKERLWDTWIVPHEDKYYLFYIRVSEGGTRWDGISLAISDDLLHWIEKGTVLVKHPEAVWLGTGMVQKIGYRYIMNFSEERPAEHQVICFAESYDLLNWKRLENELRPDSKYYLVDRTGTCDFVHRWDSIGIMNASLSLDPPYYGFVTASVPNELPGKTGAIGLIRSTDGINWECLPHVNKIQEYGAYEVPEYIQFEDRHYLIFSSSEYLSGRYSKKAGFVEGGCYYLVSKNALSGYVSPPGDPMIIGTRNYESPCMKTVARIIRNDDDILLYYQWGDLNGDGWIGVPLLLKEIFPWKLKPFYWHGTELLKGNKLVLNVVDSFPVREIPSDISSRVLYDIGADCIEFTNRGSADGVYCKYLSSLSLNKYDDGRVIECTIQVDSGLGVGFIFDCNIQQNLVYFSFRESVLKFGYIRSGWMANLSMISYTESEQFLGYSIPHRIRLLCRKFFVEVYVDDVYADGFRFSSQIDETKIGFYMDQANGTFSSMKFWQMR